MDFRCDAWRTAVNWAVDYARWAADDNEKVLSDGVLTFFYNQGIGTYGNHFTLDGTALSTDHSPGLVASNAPAVPAATATDPDLHAVEFVQALRELGPSSGTCRCYDGPLQFLAALHVAGRVGQELNLQSISGQIGVSSPTLKQWLSVLEASFLVFRLPPFFNNFGKRISKSPKIYFLDTGLLCYLLDIETGSQLERDPLFGTTIKTTSI